MKNIFETIKQEKYFLFGLIILFFVLIINAFPKGYVFGGGDTIQLIGAGDSFKRLFYDWNGAASPFYLIFYCLDKINISDSIQLSFYLGIFLIGSYVSFDLFSRLIFPKISNFFKALISLFYALNLFTLFVFTGNWGFSHYCSFYIFIPILTGLFMKFLKEQKYIYGIWFCLVLFLSSSGFGNPAFFLAFWIFLFSFVISIVIFKYIKISKKLEYKH